MRGADKLLEQIDGIALLRRQALIARATGHPVFVALPAADHPRAAVIDDLSVTLLAVPNASEGQSATLRDAVARLPQCAAFMIMLADLVALTTADLKAVLAARDLYPDYMVWRGATQTGKAGHPVLFDARLRPAFAQLTGDTGGAAIIKSHPACPVPLPGEHAIYDLDTPEDWAAFRAAAGQTAKS